MTGALQRWDEVLFHFINRACANPIGDAVFPLFNHAAPFLPLALALAAWLAWRNSPRAWKWALAIILGIALGDSLVFNPLKKALGRSRPAATLKDVRALAPGATGGWSLPSSHTANAFLAATMLAAAVPRRRAWWFSLAGVVGFARVYVGVHYPFDVAASALLGWGVGAGLVRLGRATQATAARGRPSGRAGINPAPTSVQLAQVHGVGDNFMPSRFRLVIQTAIHRPSVQTALLLLALAAIQSARLLWAATTDLDVPAALAHLWGLTQSGHAHIARSWFHAFGDSPLALWTIPWTFQTVWLVTLAWLAFRRSGKRAFAALALLSLTIPLVSQLSFAGSPALIFEGADWAASDCTRALAFYALLGLPLWITALARFRRHPFSSGLSLTGLTLGTSFPWLPWTVVALFSSGIMLQLAIFLGERLEYLGASHGRRTRAALTLLVGYGLFVSACVYSPRLLGKANLSLLPRNSPHYGQTGWREYCARIRPHFQAHSNAILWTDAFSSECMARYYLGERRSDKVQLLEWDEPAPGDLYLREVYLAQINPRVLFIPRDDEAMRKWRPRLRELDSVEIFRQGDPIRQLQLWEFTGDPGR